MSGQQILLLALFAVLVFWMVGAYNRMVALRNDIKQAWSRIDEALMLRGQAARPLLTLLNGALAAEQGALDTVQAALAEAALSAATMETRPVVEAHAAAWVAAEASLAAAASRVFALLEQSPDALRKQETVAESTALWHEADTRLVFARQRFNEACQAYNEAITLFPTRWLVPMFRFERAGRV